MTVYVYDTQCVYSQGRLINGKKPVSEKNNAEAQPPCISAKTEKHIKLKIIY